MAHGQLLQRHDIAREIGIIIREDVPIFAVVGCRCCRCCRCCTEVEVRICLSFASVLFSCASLSGLIEAEHDRVSFNDSIKTRL